jgi:Ribbon-helix-helix protein, copG family
VRTTLTLDDDVAAALNHLRKSRRGSLRDLVNEALREGLKTLTAPPRKRMRFRTRSVDLGRCLLSSVDNVAEVLAVAEDDSYK